MQKDRGTMVMKLSDAKVTPSYAHGLLIFEWGTHMLTTFSHGDVVVPMVMRLFYANPRGYRKRTEARRRFAENGVHRGR